MFNEHSFGCRLYSSVSEVYGAVTEQISAIHTVFKHPGKVNVLTACLADAQPHQPPGVADTHTTYMQHNFYKDAC